MLAKPAVADFAIVATPDAGHVEPCLEAMRRGYHVLLEKPMALDEADCRQLVEVAEQSGVILQICHVLRYAPLFAELKRALDSGELGDIVTIQHSENVSYWHYAHSYCRGNWRNRSESSPQRSHARAGKRPWERRAERGCGKGDPTARRRHVGSRRNRIVPQGRLPKPRNIRCIA